ncbi:MAG: DUF3298 domain-containing protein [Acidobacteria bacterium]|nr:DUF3298 domain-containing protein [Acidobacteriota bacterium]
MKLLALLVLVIAAPVLAQPVADHPARLILLGAIGQNYLIRMELALTDGEIKGRYHYERVGVVRPGSNSINLTGRIESSGEVVLAEFAEEPGRVAPVRTGEFTGRLTRRVLDGESIVQISGAWTRSRDGRRLPFTLEQVRPAPGGLRLTTREELEESRELNYSLRRHLPVLGSGDSAFNRHLATIVTPLVDQFRRDVTELRRTAQDRPDQLPASSLDIDHQIVAATPELLSILLTVYTYSGGAHPNSQSLALTWDLRRNAMVELADLFLPGSSYGRIISEYCRRELRRLDLGNPEWFARGTSFSQENYQRWNPTRAGLRITFDTYQVAAYAQGSFEVTVPWSLLRPLLRPGYFPAPARPEVSGR